MAEQPNIAQRNRSILVKLALVVVGMFGFAFALVPLYNVICDVTGLNGRTNSEAVSEISSSAQQEREITVHFMSHADDEMPWSFTPKVRTMKVHPGEIIQVAYAANNPEAIQMVGRAIPSVSPGAAATHFKKTECFCFNLQVLEAGESVDMPLVFYVDPALPKNIRTITLSYTLYNVTDSADAQELAQR